MKAFNPWYYYIGDELIKKPKPAKPGDYVHVSRWEGCYRIVSATTKGFVVMKHREEKNLRWDELLFHKGQGNSPESKLRRVKKALKYLLMDIA